MSERLEMIVQQLQTLQGKVADLERLQLLAFTPWTDWTPTVTQGVAVTATVTYARYCIVEKVCHVQVHLVVTGTGTGGNAIRIEGQPTAIHAKHAGGLRIIGSAMVRDASAAVFYSGVLESFLTTRWFIVGHNEVDAIGADPSFALAVGDSIGLQAVYEVD